MSTQEPNSETNEKKGISFSRRDALRSFGVAAAGLAAGVSTTTAAEEASAAPDPLAPANPYGGGPNTGITLPPYYRPTPSVKNANTFFPGVEELGSDEMRISFVGSSPVPPTHAQAGTAIMVELGNGKRFFFDLGPGCWRNITALQVPMQMINDIFITHLHADHYGELPYIYAFSAWGGRWKPLRVTGPSGRTPENGTKAMIEGMKKMLHWHTDSFNLFPIGDGYEVEVNEFDYKDDNGICYDKDGVVIRHWRRVHGKDGASGYRLDWNGLSFVWTGDGRPDENTVKYSKGVDVFVTELQPDNLNVQVLKFGMPIEVLTPTVDVAHTVHYATGYMFEQVQPRLAMATHLSYDEEMVPEMVAGIRTHYKGLFQFGAPDGVIVNVTKKSIWTRKAALAHSTNFARPAKKEAMELFDISLTKTTVDFPDPKYVISDIEDPATRAALEIDPKKYYPVDVYRTPNPIFPKGFKIDIKQMMGDKIEAAVKDKVEDIKENAADTVDDIKKKIEALQDQLRAKVKEKIQEKFK
ncbi:MAG: guanitoxin biosynthesis MBL fold metallo-hydrolase GntH [Luteolibacter sp.]